MKTSPLCIVFLLACFDATYSEPNCRWQQHHEEGGVLKCSGLNDTDELLDYPAMLSARFNHLHVSRSNLETISSLNVEFPSTFVVARLSRNNVKHVKSDAFSSFTSLETLFLDHNRIEQVRLNNLTSLEELYLNHNLLTTFEPAALRDAPPLRVLDLGYNRIEKARVCLESLEELLLNNNELASVIPLGCSKELVSADLSHNRITRIGASDFAGLQRLETLQLNDNRIVSLARGSLALERLREVRLQNNEISNVDSSPFRPAPALGLVDLAYNKLIFLDGKTFVGLENLTEINLTGNKIETLLNYAFKGLRNLKRLTFSPSFLARISEFAFADLTSLRQLDVSYSKGFISAVRLQDLSSLEYLNAFNTSWTLWPNAFINLTRLTRIVLRGNYFRSVREDSFVGLENVGELDLEGTRIVHLLPGSFNGLLNLRRLILRSNDFESLHADVFVGMPRLETLDLRDNRFSVQSGAFYELNALADLVLDGAKISSLTTGGFRGLGSLRRLDLSRKGIAEMQRSPFQGLSGLTVLDLSGNGNVSIDEDAFLGAENLLNLTLFDNHVVLGNGSFRRLPRLEHLNMSRAYLTRVPARSFSGLTSLKTLDLSGLNIGAVDGGAFSGMNSLQTLNLSNNSIDALPEKIFDGLHELLHVDLSLNGIEEIDGFAFADLSKVTSLNLTGNEISRLNNNTFSGLNRLPALDLSNLRIKSIVSGAFGGLDGLSRLDLRGNQIQVLEGHAFRGLASLSALLIDNLTDINRDAFDGLHMPASELVLDGANLAELKSGTFAGSKMRSLRIVRSHIGTIKPFAFLNNNIAEIVIDANTTINEVETKAFYALEFGSAFSLRGVNLKKIKPGAFLGTTFKSRTIYWDACSEAAIPVLSNELDLSRNDLTRLSDHTFAGLHLLHYLSLAENSISIVEPRALADLESLYALDLAHNRLETLNDETLKGPQHLVSLNLTGNALTALDFSLATLSRSVLASFTGVFTDKIVSSQTSLSRLTCLDFSSNNLTGLNVSSLAGNLPALAVIDVCDNNFTCGDLKTIIEGFRMYDIKYERDSVLEFGYVDGIACVEETVDEDFSAALQGLLNETVFNLDRLASKYEGSLTNNVVLDHLEHVKNALNDTHEKVELHVSSINRNKDTLSESDISIVEKMLILLCIIVCTFKLITVLTNCFRIRTVTNI